MEKLYTIIDTDGKVLYARYDIENIAENEIAIEQLMTESMENPHFDFETKTFYNKLNN